MFSVSISEASTDPQYQLKVLLDRDAISHYKEQEKRKRKANRRELKFSSKNLKTKCAKINTD